LKNVAIRKKIETSKQTSKQANKQTSKRANKQANKQASTMIPGAFVLKMKTRKWRLCVVKQIPKLSSSCWMLFGQNRADLTTFQMEFQPYQETTLINHITNMADTDHLVLVLVLVSDPPAVSCIESLWSLKGHEMYRKQIRTASALVNSLHQDMNMMCISPQQPEPEPESKSRHHMKTRSQTQAR
jgi:hypothetical protein